MTPLEFVGIVALGAAAGKLVFWLRHPPAPTVTVAAATEVIENSIREAFQSGMLCAADIVTHEGHEETAGRIRKTVEYVKASND
jgi:uncharacterized membrane protein